MNKMLELYDHNMGCYEIIKEKYKKGETVVGTKRATGTGKSYIGLQLALDNNQSQGIYLAPLKGIFEHLQEIISNDPNVTMDDFKNLNFMTYQSLVYMSYEEIKNLKCDFLVIDEFHHLGAPVWWQRIKTLIETHPNIKIFGMTAYTVRDRGTSYERDMALEGGDELFSDKIVGQYDLCDAIIDGVLPKFIYKTAYPKLSLTDELKELEEKILSGDFTKKEQKQYLRILKDITKRVSSAPSTKDILLKNLKPDGKYIYFCPISPEEGINDIETIKSQLINSLKEKYNEEDIVIYTTTSEMGKLGEKNREAFYNDVDLEGNDCKNKLRIILVINQYNEGIHAPGVDGVILGRKTMSDIVLFEWLGRALTVGRNLKKETEKLMKYSKEELQKICLYKDISIEEDTSKEELISKLLSPLVIDLACNYEYIEELENELKDRIKQVSEKTGNTKRKIAITDASFDIEVENIDILKALIDLKERLSNSWYKMYEYAKIYYEHHGDLKVPFAFKTNDGWQRDENGKINLGVWINDQRHRVDPNSEKGELLLAIKMRFETKKKLTWEEMYEYAKIYYEHHRDLNVPVSFKTNNGWKEDEDGKINLGTWISTQRQSIAPNSERGKLLSVIKMRFERKNLTWEEMYEYAKIYYEHHRDLNVPVSFKTNDGWQRDEDGKINLGGWISTQRKNTSPNSERGKLLLAIKMRFETRKRSKLSWKEMYEYAKIYYEHHGNLEVPQGFKTNNGWKEDEDGKINLGTWISTQRQSTAPNSERGKLLLAIKMRFETRKRSKLSWKEMYEYAKIYYEHHGNLEVPQGFKTNNGWKEDEDGKINLGKWISKQRSRVDSNSEKGKLLIAIKMRFERVKSKLTLEEMYEYAKIYYEHHGNLEVPLGFKTNNGWKEDEDGKINLGIWISNQRQNVDPNSERGKLLLTIKMRFETKKNLTWKEMYEYAKIYYEHHGNLNVPARFKTNNGWKRDEDGKINLGAWINNQKTMYKTRNLSFEQISKLESIDMIWFSKNMDNKLQTQQITDKNAIKKQKEILNRMKSLLNNVRIKEISSKDDIDNINKQFIDRLNNKKR